MGWGAGVRAISDLVDPPRVQVAVEGLGTNSLFTSLPVAVDSI